MDNLDGITVFLLILTSLAQVAVRFVIGSSDTSTCAYQNTGVDNVQGSSLAVNQDCIELNPKTNTANIVLNIISWVIGITSLVLIVLLPVWIIMLVKDLDYNKKLE